MTTTLKAKKFRLRRPAITPVAAAPAEDALLAPADDGFGPGTFPTAETDMLAEPPSADPAIAAGDPAVAGPAPLSPEDERAAIRAEGLTGKQLRMARRVAQKNGLNVDSDVEAVRLLRRQGLDPFQRSNVLDLVTSDPADPAGRVQLPQTVRPGQNMPSTRVVDEARRAAEILELQRDIARRRRHKVSMLFARLAVFVLLPTVVAAYYYYMVATPLYATRSEFVIQQAEPQGAAGLGSLFRGTQFATSQDAITVQSYLQSRDAMLRLDKDLGFKAHFSHPSIDPLQRLAPDATNERAYRLYSRNVKISYDPTEGIVKMEVIAADPQVSLQFSKALIGYAEEQVDQLTARLREDQMKGARESYNDAEAKVTAAQQRVLNLQQSLGVLDPGSESQVLMSQIGTFEVELQKKQLEMQQLLDNAQPNKARVDGVKGDIDRLKATIAGLRSQLTKGNSDAASLASSSGQLRIAEAELATRQLMLSQTLQQLETARIEANRQVRYLSMGVSPVAPDEPTYPRKFENTLLAFLVFGGIYMMLSLTASILREQVSA